MDPGGRHVVDPVEEDRLVGDRDQLLGAGVGDRAQSRASTARQDQALHRGTTVGDPSPGARAPGRPGTP